MKLIELLKKKYPTWNDVPKDDYGNPVINAKSLTEMFDELQECDEFKHARLVISQLPLIEDDGIIKQAQTHMLYNDTTYKSKCYLYQISLSPEIYRPEDVYKPVKDGCAISPVMYNPENFTPYKHILLSQQMNHNDGTYLSREDLHRKLDELLDNPNDYQVKGDRGVMLRGLMSEVEIPTDSIAARIIF